MPDSISQNDSGVGDLASGPLLEDVWRKGHFSLGSTKTIPLFSLVDPYHVQPQPHV